MEKKMEFTFGYGGVIIGVRGGILQFTRIEPPTGRFDYVTEEEEESLPERALYSWSVTDPQYLSDILEMAVNHEPFVLELDNGVIINCNKYVKKSFDNLIEYTRFALEATL